MIKIKRMVVNGFKSQNRIVEINFSEENISVIYGDNGSGKTTFLTILFALLSQDNKKLEQEKVNDIEITYQISARKFKTIKIYKEDKLQQVLFEDMKGNREKVELLRMEGYNWTEYEKMELSNLKSMFFGVQRGVQTQFYPIDDDEIFMFFRNPRERSQIDKERNLSNDELFQISHRLAEHLNSKNKRIRFLSNRSRLLDLEKNHVIIENLNIEQIEAQIIERYNRAQMVTVNRIQNALFDTFSLAIENRLNVEEDYKDFYKLLDENSDRLIHALEASSENEFTKRLIKIIKTKNISEQGQNDILIKNLLFKMIKELDEEKQYLSSINTLINVFNEHLCNNKKIFIDHNSMKVKFNGGVHSVNELSSGERHLLTFLAYVLIDGSRRSFLIIDEPEISLNIDWQRTLLPLLEKLAPNTQIIVASHSPSLVKANPNYLVEIKSIN